MNKKFSIILAVFLLIAIISLAVFFIFNTANNPKFQNVSHEIANDKILQDSTSSLGTETETEVTPTILEDKPNTEANESTSTISYITTELKYNNYFIFLKNSKNDCQLDNFILSSNCVYDTIIIKNSETNKEDRIITSNHRNSYYVLLKVDGGMLYYKEVSVNAENDNRQERSLDIPNFLNHNDNRVYSLYRQYSNIDLDTIKILNIFYIKDKNDVYFDRKLDNDPYIKIADADAETFETSSIGLLASDKNWVYIAGKRIDDFSPDGFLVINTKFPCYFKNNYKVGYLDSRGDIDYKVYISEMIDAKNAKAIRWDFPDYIKDTLYVYYKGKRIVGSDLETFKFLSPTYSVDKNHVYYWGSVIEGADPKTFKAIDEYSGYDKYKKYNGANPEAL